MSKNLHAVDPILGLALRLAHGLFAAQWEAHGFRYGIGVAPGDETLYLNLARVYVQTGKRESAREVMKELLDRNPQSDVARKALRDQLLDDQSFQRLAGTQLGDADAKLIAG